MYYFLAENNEIRNDMLKYLKDKGIWAVFHYIPLHTSPMGESFGYKKGDLPITENIASRVIRLPMYADLTDAETEYIIEAVTKYYNK